MKFGSSIHQVEGSGKHPFKNCDLYFMLCVEFSALAPFLRNYKGYSSVTWYCLHLVEAS